MNPNHKQMASICMQRAVNTCLEAEMKSIHALQMKVCSFQCLPHPLHSGSELLLLSASKTWTPVQAEKKIDDYSAKRAAFAESRKTESGVEFTDSSCLGKCKLFSPSCLVDGAEC